METESTSRPTTISKSRFARAEKSARGGLVLTERDERLLADLFAHQLMDRGQIQELYFGSVPRANARLRQLFDHGYVTRTFPALSPYGAQGLYRAGPAAAGIVAARLEMDAAEVRRACRTGAEAPVFVEHTLAVVDFYLALRRAAHERADVEIETWLPELLCRHEYDWREPGGTWRSQVFKPDAFLRLRAGGRLWSYFLEADRGHTSATKFAEKIASYRRYQSVGLFESTYGPESGPFTVLAVTTGERRLRHLTQIAAEAGEERMRFSTFGRIEAEGALAPVWTAPRGEERLSLTGEE